MLSLSKHEGVNLELKADRRPRSSWMGHPPDKVRSRKNRTRVREILMRDWDPIGVSGMPEAADEYDAYAAQVYVMLTQAQATEAAIAAYLYRIAAEHMGLGSQKGLIEKCARREVAGSFPA